MSNIKFNWIFPDSFVYPGIVAAGGMALSMFYGLKVCKLREKYGIKYPVNTGERELEDAIHQYHCTHDALPIIIPSSFMFSHFISPQWSLILGGSWIFSRMCYCCKFCCKKEGDSECVKQCHYAFTAGSQMILLAGSIFGLAVSVCNKYKLLKN